MQREKIKYGLFRATKFVPFNWLRRLTGQNFIFPFYHVVSDHPAAYVRHLYQVPSVEQFRNDLDFLMSEYHPATIEDVLEYAQTGKKPSRPLFYLSFDDGFAECAKVIAPVLSEKRLQAAFFVTPACIGNNFLAHRQKVSLIIDAVLQSGDQRLLPDLCKLAGCGECSYQGLFKILKTLDYKDTGKIETLAASLGIDFKRILEEKPYMEKNDLATLKDAGHIIGSHSLDHPEFYLISEEERMRQVEESFAFISSETGENRRLFAFPFTDDGTPVSFFKYLRKCSTDVSFGTAGLKRDSLPGHIQRIPMETDLLCGAEAVLRSEYSYYFARAFLGKNKIRRNEPFSAI